MEFEIDVSGEDLLEKGYVICIANKKGIVKGFKIKEPLLKILKSRRGEEKYRYKKSQPGNSLFKIRLYCIIIYYLFKTIKFKNNEIILEICRDFQGHEREITSQLKYFLEDKLGLKIEIRYLKLPKESIADRYSFLMRKDNKNKMDTYVKINLEEIEKYLLKK